MSVTQKVDNADWKRRYSTRRARARARVSLAFTDHERPAGLFIGSSLLAFSVIL